MTNLGIGVSPVWYLQSHKPRQLLLKGKGLKIGRVTKDATARFAHRDAGVALGLKEQGVLLTPSGCAPFARRTGKFFRGFIDAKARIDVPSCHSITWDI